VESNWTPGSRLTFCNQDRILALDGKVLEVDQSNKLIITLHVLYDPEAKLEDPSQVTFLLEAVEDSTKLTLIQDHFSPDSVAYPRITDGWTPILSNMRTLLETASVMLISQPNPVHLM
jgi:hypothetical protein|tara:strand:+ start:1427 stop:1780 length:354 start_codon:yes stop_codon:yes gene_type:complete